MLYAYTWEMGPYSECFPLAKMMRVPLHRQIPLSPIFLCAPVFRINKAEVKEISDGEEERFQNAIESCRRQQSSTPQVCKEEELEVFASSSFIPPQADPFSCMIRDISTGEKESSFSTGDSRVQTPSEWKRSVFPFLSSRPRVW